MLGWFKRILGLAPSPLAAARAELRRKIIQARHARLDAIRAKYDAAQSTDNNRRHWANADGLSAALANSPDVRKKLRERSRFEFDNNGYCSGLIQSLSNDLIGTGPTLQVLTDDEVVNTSIESAYGEWCEAVGLAEKLHTMNQAKLRDGEAFAQFKTNPEIAGSVQLDLHLIECDQIASSSLSNLTNANAVDGIDFDALGNPIAYDLLDAHPGDALGSWNSKKIARRHMLHWFRADRPGQARGVPEITASLEMFAQLRRWTLATLLAAEIAASFAATLESQAPADSEEHTESEAFDLLEIERGMLTTVPAGMKMNQFKAEQPTATYESFKREVLKEIGRPVNAPYNVIAGDSSPYNYSSARMDFLLYRGSLRVARNHCRRNVLERIFAAWLDEAVNVPQLLPAGVNVSQLPHAWYWPGFETIDPLKEALGDTERLANGTTTLKELLAEWGQDWRVFVRQRATELDLMRELGLAIQGDAQPSAEADKWKALYEQALEEQTAAA